MIEPMTTATRTAWRPRWVLAFLAAVLPSRSASPLRAPASAATAPAAENGVGASTSAGEVVVGPPVSISAGQRLGNDPPRPGIVVATGVAAKTGMSAYGVAVSGGKHAGFLKNHLGRSTPEIERGIASIEKQIAGHQAKVQNPAAHIDDWASLDPRQQQALLTSKWPGDIARQREQLDILRGILGSR